MFVPATPGSELRNIIQNIVTKKTAELGLSLLVRETSGRKMKDSLVRLDLTGCIFPKCLACKSGLEGASHTRSGTQYYIACLSAAPRMSWPSITGSPGPTLSTGSPSTRPPLSTRTPAMPWPSTSPSTTKKTRGTLTVLNIL